MASLLAACGSNDELGVTKGSKKKADAGAELTSEPQLDTTSIPVDGGADPNAPPAAPTSTPPAGPTTGTDGGVAFDAGPAPAIDAGTTRVPCYDLAYCCAMPKPCDAETIACTKVVQANDPAACEAAMDGYRIVKCAHGYEATASFLPDFYGCYGGWGGGDGP